MKKAIQDRTPLVLAHWHGDELVLVNLMRRYRIATIASTSKDGEMMNTVIRLFGGVTSRGSSTRGAVGALKGLLTLAKKGYNVSFAVDGPKGPIYKVKPGVFETSRLMKAPIFVSGIKCSSAIQFPNSWNKTYLPKPFSKIQIVWSGPWGPVNRTTDPRDTAIAQELEDLLGLAKSEAEKMSRC
jgi:lysophospholipid acyltransferase (LPLAT)-like uncharacterized protein